MYSTHKPTLILRHHLQSGGRHAGNMLRQYCAFALAAPLMVLATGCGGSGGASQPAPPAVTSVSASCSPATVQTGQTSQCTATVIGTGSYSSAVNWSVNSTPGGNSTLGTISSSGLYTAPATIATGSANVSVVASSQSSPAITGSASIALSYPSPKITSVAPNAINAGSAATVVTIQGSNFTTASSVYLGTSAISTSFVSSSTLQATIPASSLNLAGALSVDVTNPQPGGGSSASQQISVVPQLVSVTPNSAPVGGSVNLQLTGVDSSNASSVVVSFAQTGRTFNAGNGTFTASGGTPVLSIAVPSGLAPASASAPIGAPAQIAASVNSIAATATLPFTVQPPTHAGEISPATVQIGLSVPMTFAGVATAFDGSTTITSDDPGITFTGSAANSSTIFLSNMTVAAGTKLGTHTITVTEQGNALQYALQVLAAAAAPVISSASPTSGAPASPITITGTGFGADTSTSVVLDFSYAGAEVQTPATATSATEIDSFMPVLIDPNSGSVYAGPVSLAVIINGQLSNALSITLSPLPANSSAVGTTTLAAIDQAITNTTNAQAQLATPALLSSDQADSANALFMATVASLNTFRANVVAAASGQTVTNPDGTTFDASSVDVLDRLLQSGGSQTGVTPALRGLASNDGLRPLAQNAQDSSSATDQQFARAGQFCSSLDAFKQFNTYFGLATNAVCLASIAFPAAAPACGLLKAYTASATIVTDVGGAICDAEPDTLGAVLPSPTSISTFVNGPPVVEMPQGTFESSPHQPANGLVSLLELAIDQLGKLKGISNFFTYIGVGKDLGEDSVSTLSGDFDQFLEHFADDKAPTWGAFTSKTVPLTLATTSLIADRNNLVGTSGLTVTPGSQTGETFLSFDTSAFRMFDATGKVTTEPTLVPGNMLQVTIGNATVVVSPMTATVAPGGTQQFTATVQGPTNTAVSWSVNGFAGGNAAVGTISDQGLYAAPANVPSPATVNVTATSQADASVTGSASLTISKASIAVNPAIAYVPVNTSQQFLATLQGVADTSASWAVNGIVGGNGIVGTITTSGLYQSPATVPLPAAVTISASNLTASSVIGAASALIFNTAYTFTTLDNPYGNGLNLSIPGINNNGQIIGNDTDATSCNISFLLSSGNFSLITPPNLSCGDIYATGINNNGELTGWYNSLNSSKESQTYAFIYRGSGNYTLFTDPSANATAAQPSGINSSDIVVGIYGSSSVPGLQSFRYDGKTFTNFSYPGAFATGVYGINDNGDILGWLATVAQGMSINFLYSKGTFNLIKTPNGLSNFQPMGINSYSQIVGTAVDQSGTHGVLVNPDSSFIVIDYPGADSTKPNGINDFGQIVGTYTLKSSSLRYGFLATPK